MMDYNRNPLADRSKLEECQRSGNCTTLQHCAIVARRCCGNTQEKALRAEVERLRGGYRRILDFTDSGMRDGDAARDVAREMLGESSS